MEVSTYDCWSLAEFRMCKKTTNVSKSVKGEGERQSERSTATRNEKKKRILVNDYHVY